MRVTAQGDSEAGTTVLFAALRKQHSESTVFADYFEQSKFSMPVIVVFGFVNHTIHMNGRIYDPTLGRMLQADPFIQAPGNTQSFNRYSYVLNNPLVYTDPSGYFFNRKKWAGTIVAVVGTIACYGSCGPALWGAVGAASGGVGAAANGGDILQGALIGGISAAAFSAVAGADFSSFNDFSGVVQFASFGAVGGLASSLSGGNFGHGFISAGVGGMVGIKGGVGGTTEEIIGRTLVKTLIGGTVSALTGDKFANGAATAAFASIIAEGLAAANDPDGGYGAGGNRDRRIYAAEDGEIETAGWENPRDHKQGYGYRVKLRADDDSSLFVYGHVDPASLNVSVGDTVTEQQLIGVYADPTNGSSTAPHLHFEHWSAKGARLDPAAYLRTVMPNYSVKDTIRFRGVHPVSGKAKWHNGYDIVGPFN